MSNENSLKSLLLAIDELIECGLMHSEESVTN
jgi:hypothetical protein